MRPWTMLLKKKLAQIARIPHLRVSDLRELSQMSDLEGSDLEIPHLGVSDRGVAQVSNLEVPHLWVSDFQFWGGLKLISCY